MTSAPSAAASFVAVARSCTDALCASTRMILQSRQMVWTVSTSSEISSAQPESKTGSGEAAPFWFTTAKHDGSAMSAHVGNEPNPQ